MAELQEHSSALDRLDQVIDWEKFRPTYEKGYRNRPLTEEQKENNRQKSRVRARIEHVFGYVTNSMGGIFLTCIGMRRTTAAIGLMNLIYNMARYEQLMRLANSS